MKAPSKQALNTMTSNREMMVLLAFLLIFVVAVVAVYGYVAIRSGYDKEFITLVGDQEVLSQRLSKHAGQALEGEGEAFQQLRRDRGRFQDALTKLRSGNPDSGMPPAPEKVSEPLEALTGLWQAYNGHIQTILSRQETVTNLHQTVAVIDGQAQQLAVLADEAAVLMSEAGAPADQTYFATRQVMLAERLVNAVNRILSGGTDAVRAADRFSRDIDRFGRVLDGMLNGNAELGVGRADDPEVRQKLQEIDTAFAAVREEVDDLLRQSPEMFEVSEAVQGVIDTSDALLNRLGSLGSAYRGYMDGRRLNANVGNMFGLAALLVLIYVGIRLRTEGQERVEQAEAQRQESEEVNQRNQQAIIRLLDEMEYLADGDLTVTATVTEDITGAIADSINYAIDTLRGLVAAINDTAEKVSVAAERTQATTRQLAESSEYQAKQINTVTNAVQKMAGSIDGVSKNADQLAEESGRSLEIAHNGAEVVQKTIRGMDSIRDRMQETSKRIKRLGESSQEIGDTVGLINDIAEQTNILALNASIQAAMAGDAGRGFAVVADEVQRLAERSADATKQIESLVKTIQSDTSEAINSMEQSTSEVVAGAKLAEDAGSALEEVEGVSKHLAQLVDDISDATRQQAEAAANVSQSMTVIRDITAKNREGTNQTAVSVGELAELVTDLKGSVAGFKLPQ